MQEEEWDRKKESDKIRLMTEEFCVALTKECECDFSVSLFVKKDIASVTYIVNNEIEDEIAIGYLEELIDKIKGKKYEKESRQA